MPFKRYLRIGIKYPTPQRADDHIEESDDRLPDFSPHNAFVLNGNEPANRLAPVGECIYCDSKPMDTSGLTEEHVISEGLGARLILPAASCDCCRNKTRAIEGAILRTLLWHPDGDSILGERNEKK